MAAGPSLGTRFALLVKGVSHAFPADRARRGRHRFRFGIATADVKVDSDPQPSYTIVFGDWLQFAGDDVFNAGHDNTVGSDN